MPRRKQRAPRAGGSCTVDFDLPLFAEFRATPETLAFSYVLSDAATVQARLGRKREAITVTGALANKAAAVKALQRFNKRYAADVLEPLVYELADRHGLKAPESVHIKLMRTRWGSYSSRGSLNLSQNLIFLPRELATHVLLHELAHTEHMNHGSDFHALLAKLDPNKENHVMALRKGQSYIPTWADVHV